MITPVSLGIPQIPSIASKPTGDTGFGQVFADAINQVDSFQKTAQVSANKFLAGDGEELHQVALKTQEADLSFELFMQVRNKIVSAYQEVMRMQV